MYDQKEELIKKIFINNVSLKKVGHYYFDFATGSNKKSFTNAELFEFVITFFNASSNCEADISPSKNFRDPVLVFIIKVAGIDPLQDVSAIGQK